MTVNILIAGAGSLGSQIAHHLARPGVKLYILDDDMVETQNITVSVYSHEQLAMSKAHALTRMAKARGAEAEAMHTTLISPEQINAIPNLDIVIDCFDNVDAREITTQTDVHTVHVGVGEHGNGMVYWDTIYKLPKKTFERGHNPICTNALGATILRRTALRAYELVDKFIRSGEKESDITSQFGSM